MPSAQPSLSRVQQLPLKANDAIGSPFTFKGTAAATEGEEPIGELDGFISDAAGLPVSLGILSICKELRSEGAGLGACEGTDDDG